MKLEPIRVNVPFLTCPTFIEPRALYRFDDFPALRPGTIVDLPPGVNAAALKPTHKRNRPLRVNSYWRRRNGKR